MPVQNIVGESGANAAATHTVPIRSDTKIVKFESLTVSTQGADIGADVKVSILDGNRERWVAYLRSGKVYDAHYNDIGDIIISNGSCSIKTTAGGASCVVATSAVVYYV